MRAATVVPTSDRRLAGREHFLEDGLVEVFAHLCLGGGEADLPVC